MNDSVHLKLGPTPRCLSWKEVNLGNKVSLYHGWPPSMYPVCSVTTVINNIQGEIPPPLPMKMDPKQRQTRDKQHGCCHSTLTWDMAARRPGSRAQGSCSSANAGFVPIQRCQFVNPTGPKTHSVHLFSSLVATIRSAHSTV